MKKSIYYLTALALAASCLPQRMPVSAATSVKFKTETLLEVDFDDTTADFTFSASNNDPAGHANEIKDSAMPGHGKALALKRSGTAEYGVYADTELGDASILENKGKYLIEYDTLSSATDEWAPYIILSAGTQNTRLSVIGANSSPVLCSYAADPNKLGWWAIHEQNPEEKVTLFANSWMNVKILVDTVASTADYYYDDTYVGSQTASQFGSALKGGLSKLRFELWSHSGFEPEVLIDNLSISRVLPTVKEVSVVDASGERLAAKGTLRTISNALEITVENLSSEKELTDTITLTDSEGDVAYTASFSGNICTLYLDENFKNGESYALSVLDQSYQFDVTYGDSLYVSKIALKPLLGNEELKNLDTVTAKTALKAEAMLVNPNGEEGNYSIVAVCYDGNRVVSARTKTITIDSSKVISTDNLAFAAPAAEKLAIRVFVYDNLTNLNPLSAGLAMGAAQTAEEGHNVFTVEADGKDGDQAVLCIWAPGKTAADLPEAVKPTDILGTLAYLHQEKISADGKASFTVKLDENSASGAYVGTLSVGTSVKPIRLTFVNKTENAEALASLKNSANLLDDIKANSAALGFGCYNETVPESAYGIYADYCKNHTIDENDFKANQKLVQKAELLASVNAGTISNLFTEKGILDTELSEIRAYMDQTYFTESMQKAITKRVRERKCNDLSKLSDVITEAFVLALVENPNGYKNITPVLSKFADEINVSDSQISDAVSQKLSGKDYADYAALKSAVLAANKKETGGPTGGGSSGSNKGGSTGGIVSAPGAILKEPVKEIPQSIYTDVPAEHWASEAIVNLTEKGVISGKGENLFDPNAKVTREEFTKMIVAAFFEGEDAPETVLPFEDVQKDAWYYSYLQTAYAQKLISGQTETFFGIGENITRQDAAVILNRTATVGNYNFTVPESPMRFSDDDAIASYASEAVYTLKEAGVLKGDGGAFHPTSNTTRAEAAVLIYNMLSM